MVSGSSHSAVLKGEETQAVIQPRCGSGGNTCDGSLQTSRNALEAVALIRGSRVTRWRTKGGSVPVEGDERPLLRNRARSSTNTTLKHRKSCSRNSKPSHRKTENRNDLILRNTQDRRPLRSAPISFLIDSSSPEKVPPSNRNCKQVSILQPNMFHSVSTIRHALLYSL